MALTANTLPAIVPHFDTPYDAQTAMAAAQTLTATGYFGSPTQVDLGQGRCVGLWALDITNLKSSAGNEEYTFHLLGSNDVNWGNGNVEQLLARDVGPTRMIATILGASPAIPPTNLSGTLLQIPFTNLSQRIVYRYIRGYVVIAGTAPTVTLSSWLTMLDINL